MPAEMDPPENLEGSPPARPDDDEAPPVPNGSSPNLRDELKAEADLKTEPDSGAEPESKAEPETNAESEPESKTEPESKEDSESKSEPDSKAEPELMKESEMKKEPGSESKPAAETEAEPRPPEKEEVEEEPTKEKKGPLQRLRRRAAPSLFEGSTESGEGSEGDSGDDYAPVVKKKKATDKLKPKCTGSIRIASVESLSKSCEARDAFSSMRAEAAAISARLRDRCAKLEAKADVHSVGGALKGVSAAFEALAATKADVEAAEARFRREFCSLARTRGWRQQCEGLPKLLETIDDGGDSDCEVVGEIPSPSPVGGDLYAALRRMESQGISWKNTKAPRDPDPPIRLKDVTVKRVKRTEPGFFRQDGRELRPPDKRVARFTDQLAINGPDGNRISSKILSPSDPNLNSMRKAKRKIDQMFKAANFGRQVINYEHPMNIMRLIKSGNNQMANLNMRQNIVNGIQDYRKLDKAKNHQAMKGPHLLKPIKIMNEINFDPMPQYGKHLSNSNNKDIFSELFHSQLEKMKHPP